jgi:hypothetical protein
MPVFKNSCIVGISLTMLLTSSLFAETIAKKQADSELTVMGVVVGKTTLDEAKTKFKSINEIYHEGEGATSVYALCFKSSNGSTLAFETDESGGSTHVIGKAIVNAPGQTYRFSSICEKTSMIKTKLGINGVSLGMSSDLIKRVKGKPSSSTVKNINYQFEMNEAKSELDIELKDNAVSVIVASKKIN